MDDKKRRKRRPGPAPENPYMREVDVDELLADARRLSGEPDAREYRMEEPSVVPKEATAPDEMPEDPLQVMTEQMRELSVEIKLLRARLEEIMQEDTSVQTPEIRPSTSQMPEQKPKNKALNVISNILFYVVVIAVVVGAFLIKSSSGGRPTMIAGFSAFQVLTSSMEDVYPKGSLIITKHVDADELAIGDDITFMVSETSSVTHRIISITEDFLNTGERGFETQGVMNEKPDKDMVAAANVVGQVIFCSKLLGDMAVFAKNNWPLLIFALVVIVALITFLKWNARREDENMPKKKSKYSNQNKI